MAAHQVFQPQEFGSDQVASYVLIEPGSWIKQAEDQFWSFGIITIPTRWIPLPTDYGDTYVSTGPTRTVNGARLDPVGIDNLRAQLGLAPLTPPHGDSGVNEVVEAVRKGVEELRKWGPSVQVDPRIIHVGIHEPAHATDGHPPAIEPMARGGEEMTLAQIRTDAAIAALASSVGPAAPQRAVSIGSGKFANKARKEEIEAWLAPYAAEHHDLHFKAIRDAAKKHFHPRPVTELVTKAAIEALNMTLTPGNPRITQK